MGDEQLAMTRRTLHAVAELVLAGPQFRATGKLRLRVVPAASRPSWHRSCAPSAAASSAPGEWRSRSTVTARAPSERSSE